MLHDYYPRMIRFLERLLRPTKDVVGIRSPCSVDMVVTRVLGATFVRRKKTPSFSGKPTHHQITQSGRI